MQALPCDCLTFMGSVAACCMLAQCAVTQQEKRTQRQADWQCVSHSSSAAEHPQQQQLQLVAAAATPLCSNFEPVSRAVLCTVYHYCSSGSLQKSHRPSQMVLVQHHSTSALVCHRGTHSVEVKHDMLACSCCHAVLSALRSLTSTP